MTARKSPTGRLHDESSLNIHHNSNSNFFIIAKTVPKTLINYSVYIALIIEENSYCSIYVWERGYKLSLLNQTSIKYKNYFFFEF